VPLFSLRLEGGFSTEDGPSAPYRTLGNDSPTGEVIVGVPWLVAAENIVYTLDGWFRKMPGAANVNATATGATDSVMGIFDYWRMQTTGSPTQQTIVYSGTQFYRESAGTLTSIATGFEADKMPWFETMGDVCVIATTSTVDVPQTWNQTTFAALGGSPPNFDFHARHKNRMWAAGNAAAKFRLYYSALDNHADWTGAGSGSLDLPGQISGLWSHNNELLVFLGPNEPEIHRMVGSAPTGTDAFALRPLIRGVGATNQQAIIPAPGGDVWFWDDGGIHSMSATEQFGDYAPKFLSAQINDYFTNQLNHNRFGFVWGANFAGAGYALWTCTRAGAITNDLVIMLDYRFTPVRFALWPAYAFASLAMIRDVSRLTVPWAGTYTGRVRRMNQANRNNATVAYNGRVTTPYLGFGDAFVDKMLQKGRVGFVPKGDTTFTVAWRRDGNTQQTSAVSQVGNAMLGSSTDDFVLDTDVLDGGRYVQATFDMAGSFKELELEFSQATVDVDYEPHSFTLDLDSGGMGTARTLG